MYRTGKENIKGRGKEKNTFEIVALLALFSALTAAWIFNFPPVPHIGFYFPLDFSPDERKQRKNEESIFKHDTLIPSDDQTTNSHFET